MEFVRNMAGYGVSLELRLDWDLDLISAFVPIVFRGGYTARGEEGAADVIANINISLLNG